MRVSLIWFFFIFQIQANEDLDKIYHFAEDNREIAWKLAPLSDNFHLDTEQADRAKAYGELDGEIAEYAYGEPLQETDPCPDDAKGDQGKGQKELAERIKKRRFNIYFTATFSDKTALDQAEGFFGKNNYKNYMHAHGANGHPGAYQIASINSLENKYLAANGSSGWAGKTLKEKADLLQAFAKDRSGVEVPAGMILSEYAIGHMVQNPNDWKSSLNEVKDHLSFEEKMKLASHLGGRFSDNYNYDRADGVGDRKDGIVTIEQLLDSVKHSDPGGVCRDVALAQAQILTQLGVPKDKVYMMGYRTATGGHAVLAVQDPNDKDKIVKLNYDYVSESDNVKGAAALVQDTSLPDTGIQYRLFDADGKPVGKIPSEMGQVLREATGASRTSNELVKTYSLQKVGVETPFGAGNVFSGQTSGGDKIVGVAIDHTIKTKYAKMEVGGAYVERESDRTRVTLSQDAFYGRMKTTLNTPDFKAGNFSFRGDVATELEIMAMDNKVTYKGSGLETGGKNMDFSDRHSAGISAFWNSDDERTHVMSRVEVEGYVDFKNEAAGTSGGSTLVHNQTKWTTGVAHDISANMRLIGNSAIVLKEVGNSATFTGAMEYHPWDMKVKGGYQRPLDDDIPAFMPESREAATIGVEKSWNNGLHIQLDYSRDIDTGNNTGFITGGWKF